MFTLNEKPPAFASRAVGILEGQLVPNPIEGERAIVLRTADGTEIPGVVHNRAAERIIEDPSLFAQTVRLLVYPRTDRNLLRIIAVDLEEVKPGERCPDRDFFLVQGFNIGSRRAGLSQLGIRPNKKSKHQFEKFWINLFGHLNEETRCVYRVRALRRGRKLYIMESEPILPDKCSPKRSQPIRRLTTNSPQFERERSSRT